MGKKINIALLFGGKSVEHEVSLQSGLSVARALDPSRYEVSWIGIDKEGNWNGYDTLEHEEDPQRICLGKKGAPVDPFNLQGVDLVFPTLHGTYGEDGTVQGLLKMAGVPFVGADVLGSAIGMDKDVAKRLAKEAGIATTRWVTLQPHDPIDVKDLSYPLFVKPATGGSSIGIAKVATDRELFCAVKEAFAFSEKVLLEEAVLGKEIQVAVFGNEEPKASLPCQIIPNGEFHSYDSKYIDKKGAQFLYPAPLDADETTSIQKVALALYRTLGCEVFGRVDLFLSDEGTILFNEINTIPGLTKMSPYARMWEVSGLPFAALVDQLIALSMQRHQRQSKLITSYEEVKK